VTIFSEVMETSRDCLLDIVPRPKWPCSGAPGHQGCSVSRVAASGR